MQKAYCGKLLSTHFLQSWEGGNGKLLIVDDLINTGNDELMIKAFKKNMMIECEMTDFGVMHYFLGIEVV